MIFMLLATGMLFAQAQAQVGNLTEQELNQSIANEEVRRGLVDLAYQADKVL